MCMGTRILLAFCAIKKKRDWCMYVHGTRILPTHFVLWGKREIDVCAWEPEFSQLILCCEE
jgi:hypothetical protein